MGSDEGDVQVHDEEAVRTRVNDLIRLAEMKWRYRVVEKGQSPRDEALKVLEEVAPFPPPSPEVAACVSLGPFLIRVQVPGSEGGRP